MAQETQDESGVSHVHVDSSALIDALLEGRGSHNPGVRRAAPLVNSNSASALAGEAESASTHEIHRTSAAEKITSLPFGISGELDGVPSSDQQDISYVGNGEGAVLGLRQGSALTQSDIDDSAPHASTSTPQELLVPIAGHESPALTMEASVAEGSLPCAPPLDEVLSTNPAVAALQRQRSTEMASLHSSAAASVVLKPELAADSRSVAGAQLAAGQRVLPSHFDLLKVIGRGAYGKVLLVRHKGTRKVYAMKVFDKDYLVQKGQVSYTHVERNIMAAVRHPFLVQLRFALQNTDSLFLVMDFLAGGDLVTHLQRQGILTEDAARVYAAEMVLALEHLHSLGIVHRDLKPENVLLGADGHIRLTDYGLAKVLGTGEDGRTRTLCGTTEYMAPEMVAKPEGGYTSAVDWWSLGALLYEMLTGRPPFEGKDIKKLYKKILTAPLNFPRHLSPKVQSLLKGLMDRDPQSRLGARRTTRFALGGVPALKLHVFFKRIDWSALVALQVPPPIPIAVSQDNDVAYFDDLFTSQPLLDDTGTGRVAVGNGGEAATAASSTRRGATVHSSHNEAGTAVGDVAVARRFRGFSFVHPDIEEEYEGVYDFCQGGLGGASAPESPTSSDGDEPAPVHTGPSPHWLSTYDAVRAVEVQAEEQEAAATAAVAAADAEAQTARKAVLAAERAKQKKGKKKKGGRRVLAEGGGGSSPAVTPPTRQGRHTAAGRPIIRDISAPVGLSGGSRRVSNTSMESLPKQAPPAAPAAVLLARSTAAAQQPVAVPAAKPKVYKPSGMWAALAAGSAPAAGASAGPAAVASGGLHPPVSGLTPPRVCVLTPPAAISSSDAAPTAPSQTPLVGDIIGGGKRGPVPAAVPQWGAAAQPAAPPLASRWAALASAPLGSTPAPVLQARKKQSKTKWTRVSDAGSSNWR